MVTQESLNPSFSCLTKLRFHFIFYSNDFFFQNKTLTSNKQDISKGKKKKKKGGKKKTWCIKTKTKPTPIFDFKGKSWS